MEQRSARLQTSIEPSLYVLVMVLLKEQDLGQAEYIRSLILADLKSRNKLSNEILERIIA